DGRHPLPDRDVDADQVLVLVVDDRVDRDRRLAGLAVADDQLSLAAADRDHPVDRHQAGLDRLLDRLALDDAGGFELGRAGLRSVDVSAVVERAAERVDQAAEQLLADRDLEQVAGAFDGVALDDLAPLAEEDGADVVRLEVEREAGHPVRQLEHLQRHAVVEAVDAGDAVGDRQHRADLGEVGARRVHALDPLPENRCDLVRLDLHFGALSLPHAACATLFRSFSRRLWMLASRTMLPTCSTIPPRLPSSPRLASSTFWPVWRSTSAPTSSTTAGSSSTALVTVTSRRLFSCFQSASKRPRMRKISGIRCFSTSS